MEDPVKSIQTDPRAAFEAKVRRGIFNPVARFLPEDVREDRLQEGIAQTWAMYERCALRGELLDDAILVHACGQRAADASRYYVPCEGYQRKRDALDPRNYMEGTVEVLRLADLHEEEEDGDQGHRLNQRDRPISIGFAEVRCNNPVRKILSAIDLTAWLGQLAPEDRRMLELRAAGYTLEETADRLGVSLSVVFARCRRLGEELAERAGIPIEPRAPKSLGTEAPTSTPGSSARNRPAVRRGRPRKTPSTWPSEAMPSAA
jgi:hypothetical protein